MTWWGRLRPWFFGALWLAVGVVLGVLVERAWPGPLHPLQDAAVSGVDPATVAVETVELGRWGARAIVVEPVGAEVDRLLVVYPGGAVRPQAYTWMGVALAADGVRTVIPEMPLDLAVFAPDRGAAVLARYGAEADRIVVAGHSLGGAMAARWILRDEPDVDALALLGAYPAAADDLSSRELDVVVLVGDRDAITTPAEVRAGLDRLPPDARWHVVEGAVHSFFGRYGPQRGDGVPTVARAAAEADIAEQLRAVVELGD